MRLLGVACAGMSLAMLLTMITMNLQSSARAEARVAQLSEQLRSATQRIETLQQQLKLCEPRWSPEDEQMGPLNETVHGERVTEANLGCMLDWPSGAARQR